MTNSKYPDAEPLSAREEYLWGEFLDPEIEPSDRAVAADVAGRSAITETVTPPADWSAMTPEQMDAWQRKHRVPRPQLAQQRLELEEGKDVQADLGGGIPKRS